MRQTIETIRRNPPLVHRGGNDLWALSDDALRFIERTVAPGDVTVETGLGASTVLFAALGTRHTCICPDTEQVDRLKAYCREEGIGLETVRFLTERSENALSDFETAPISLALIDGGHGFPIPFIDWFYLARSLKVGGTVIVDDTQLWTGAVLRDYLKNDNQWTSLEDDLGSRTSAFRLDRPFEAAEWDSQPYVVDRSRWTQRRQLIREAGRHLARGDIGGLYRKVARRLSPA